MTTSAPDRVPAEDLNEVRLVGRVSGLPEPRILPSGDPLVTFRLVIRRASPTKTPSRASVDTLDVSVWAARPRASAERLAEGDRVEVTGSLRRRFYRTATGTASRYEIEAERVRRVKSSAPKC